MRTANEIELEACLMATQATAATGYAVFLLDLAYKAGEDCYWDDWTWAYDKALVELESENEQS